MLAPSDTARRNAVTKTQGPVPLPSNTGSRWWGQGAPVLGRIPLAWGYICGPLAPENVPGKGGWVVHGPHFQKHCLESQ